MVVVMTSWYKRQCCSLIPAKSDSLPHAHAQDFKVKHSASSLLLLNKNVIGQKAQVHVIILFRNSDNHKFPQYHQRSSKSNKIGKIVSQMKKRRLGAFETSMSMVVKSTS
ncbi:hypothetical protein Tco_0628504 [Tanacetum coccineum]|uniref:Uncharacterized protein n=1 Tax=Tanacetum coccineum TaxID=301880 RepID=A0ABQ4WQH3_9ASTR